MKTETIKLNPCASCGRQPTAVKPNEHYKFPELQCLSCSIYVCGDTDADAEAEWNKRNPPPKPEAVAHPPHYNAVPGIECIAVAQHFNFNLGNAIKYIWRCGHKGPAVEDLEKARQYINFEIERLKGTK